MILNKNRNSIENTDLEQMIYFIKRVHDMADFYQTTGMKPVDLISSHPDFFDILERYYKCNSNDIDMNGFTWAAACSFIIFNSLEYIDIIKKYNRLNWSKEHTKH